MNSVLRLPKAGDYAVLASWLPDAEACLHWAGSLITFPLVSERLASELNVVDGQGYFLVDANDGVVGFGQHWVLKPEAVHLGRIIIAPSQRGLGFGRDLCIQLMAKAKAITGAGTVTLRVYRNNHGARVLYESLGFLPVAAESSPDVLFMVHNSE